MVAKLSLPACNTLHTINQIITERVQHRDFFDLIKDNWLLHIHQYIQLSGNPELITPLDISPYITHERIEAEENRSPGSNALETLIEKRKASLNGLYKPTEETELHSHLKNMRDHHGLLFCPACGEPGKPTTLDHYLPQSLYPELSVVFENLTPMCDKCQRLKNNKILNDEGKKLFIHPYYDQIESVYISLDIIPPYKHPQNFLAKVPDNITSPLREICERHIKELDFLNRFEDYCISEYSDLLVIISVERSEPERDSVRNIIKRFLRKAEIRSPNRWEAIFYRGILDNEELLTFLETEELF
ncbi:HNH endonuclease [Aeromonas veronii]|uniref:HNH endonuclease n=2 Tax=Aeromonas veronii TaxID=654 RepID=UPI00111780AD|nr:HNH endonuclease [Aeromonas veronii]